MRHGMSEGLMLEAIARMAGRPVAEVRRMHMLEGDVGRVVEGCARRRRAQASPAKAKEEAEEQAGPASPDKTSSIASSCCERSGDEAAGGSSIAAATAQADARAARGEYSGSVSTWASESRLSTSSMARGSKSTVRRRASISSRAVSTRLRRACPKLSRWLRRSWSGG